MADRKYLLSIFLALTLAPVAPVVVASPAEAISQEKAACKQQEQREGTSAMTSAVVCAIKTMFQNRIRRKKDTEPVEMIVGSPPMQTEDTDTPGANNWEINISMEAVLTDRERRIEGPVFDINYGVGERLQLTYELPYVFQTEWQPAPGGDRLVSAHGIGDSILGLKYRFYDNEDTGLSLAIYPQIEFRAPGADRAVSEGSAALILPLVVTREFEHAAIGANVGVEATAHERRYFASFGAGGRATDRTALLAEIAVTDLNAADKKRVLINIGVRHKLKETQSLTAAFGRDVYAGGDQRRSSYVSFAYQKLFGE